MAGDLEIRALSETDDRSAFTCGQADLDRYFQHFAGQNQFRHHLSVTYVAVLEKTILGFASVSSGAIERQQLPPAKKRPPAYPLPVLRLARLGVATVAQQMGIGRALLGHVLSLALKQRDASGCVGVVTDAKPEAVAWYERYGFIPMSDVREGGVLGAPVAMFLPMNLIAASQRG